MTTRAETVSGAPVTTVGLGEILVELSRESHRLAEQCGSIQRSLSAILDIVHHPDLGAEIQVLQNIDRIQQTLSDVSAILAIAGGYANGAQIHKDEIGAAVRLDRLRLSLGLSEDSPEDDLQPKGCDITWF